NTVFNVLNPKFVTRQPMVLDQDLPLCRQDGSELGIVIHPFAVPGKVALWLEDESKGANFGSVDEDTIALEVKDANGETCFFYIPACASMTTELADRIRGTRLVFFDGTLWVDDEMVRDGVGVKTGKRMGHMSISGPDGTLAAFKDLDIARKLFIHINTTNSVLLEDSPERAEANAAGWEVTYDGMAIEV
ncbi:MAG: pyrroloquinoline quinone biosynthesis protein B, partial [Gammaproteobacteria bacterium]|nr:pyrroloquinoline quinone biosynthesis protein B [Gammaproteobacteria bacterium]